MERYLLIQQKEKEYKDYINEHINNVKIAWKTMQNSDRCMEIIKHNMCYDSEMYILSLIEFIVNNHDRSKFSPEEFYPYRKYFYPVDEEEKKEVENSGEFDKAWVHHYNENPHHWDHWKNDPDCMSFIYVLEMVLDWIAMGIKFNNTALDWYEKNKDNIILGEKQKHIALALMNAYYEK